MASPGTVGQTPIDTSSQNMQGGPGVQGSNGLGQVVQYGANDTLVPPNPAGRGPQRGGTILPQGQAGVVPQS
jgi:hypothetical protein